MLKSSFFGSFTEVKPTFVDEQSARRSVRKMKGRSLGERPAFLGSPPGCGLSKPLGVWEGGFEKRLGEPLAGYGNWGEAQTGHASIKVTITFSIMI